MKAEDRLLYKDGLAGTGTPMPGEIEYARRRLLSGDYGEHLLSRLAALGASRGAVLDGLRSHLNLTGAGVARGFVGTRVEDEAHDYAMDRDGIVALFGDEPERWEYLPGSGYGSVLGPIHPRLMYMLEDVPLDKIRVVRIRLSDLAREAVDRHAQPSLLEAS